MALPDPRDTPWPECGIARFLKLLDGPWATLVVRELLPGPMRFTELRRALPGVSAHTLTNRLRQFEAYGIVTRTVYAEVPPRVEYQLTDVGLRLRSVLEAMDEWANSVPRVEGEGTVPLPASCQTPRLAQDIAGVRQRGARPSQ